MKIPEAPKPRLVKVTTPTGEVITVDSGILAREMERQEEIIKKDPLGRARNDGIALRVAAIRTVWTQLTSNFPNTSKMDLS